jgi:hypothetical protein
MLDICVDIPQVVKEKPADQDQLASWVATWLLGGRWCYLRSRFWGWPRFRFVISEDAATKVSICLSDRFSIYMVQQYEQDPAEFQLSWFSSNSSPVGENLH